MQWEIENTIGEGISIWVSMQKMSLTGNFIKANVIEIKLILIKLIKFEDRQFLYKISIKGYYQSSFY